MEKNEFFLEAKRVRVLHSKLGDQVIINHPIGYRLEMLAKAGFIDAVIVDTEDGFSQLGMMRRFLANDLGLEERDLAKWALDGFPENLERNIASLADWNRGRFPQVTLVAIPSQRPESLLKGMILSPYDDSKCFESYKYPRRKIREFIYNCTYEAIDYAYSKWNAKHIGITHFARSKYKDVYQKNITTFQIEAMVHFCNEHKGIESFTFLDDSEGNHPLEIVESFNLMNDVGIHHPIQTEITELWGIDFVDLDLEGEISEKRNSVNQVDIDLHDSHFANSLRKKQ